MALLVAFREKFLGSRLDVMHRSLRLDHST